MNCVLYARVSTEKQADKELSIPAQLRAMRDYTRARQWQVVKEFIEPGASARTADRPVLKELLAAIRDGEVKVEALLVHKIDRLARNVYDHATIRALLQQRGVRLASVVENVDDSISGQLVENIMASIAQFYSGNLGEEVKKGMRQKVLHGGWPHLPPIGYAIVRPPNGPSAIEPDPATADLVRTAFELYASGRWGTRALAKHLEEEGLRTRGGKPLCAANVRKMLFNPFYAGVVRWKGREYPGNHVPLISRALRDRVQMVSARRFRQPGAKSSLTLFPLKVVGVCASCRGRLTAERHGKWRYYRCTRRMFNASLCNARMCNADIAEKQVGEICRTLAISEDLAKQIERAALALIDERHAHIDKDRERLLARLEQLRRREETATEAFIAERLKPTVFSHLSDRIGLERANITDALRALNEPPVKVKARIVELLGEASTVLTLFDRLSRERQVVLLESVFKAVVISHAGVRGYTVNRPFGDLASHSLGATRRSTEHPGSDFQGVAKTLVDTVVATDRRTTIAAGRS